VEPTRPTTARIYEDYDRIVGRVEAWVARCDPRVANCDDVHVRARIVQRIVDLTSDGYAGQRASLTHSLCAGDAGRFIVNGVGVNPDSGRVSVSLRQRLSCWVSFFAVWARTLGVLVKAVTGPAPAHDDAVTLLLDTPAGCERSDAQFVRFCREGRIAVLRQAKRVVAAAATTPEVTDARHFAYSPQPLHRFFERELARGLRWRLLVLHLCTPFRYLHVMFAAGLRVLLARDLALLPLIALLSKRRRIDAMIITTSSFTGQPLWMVGMTGRTFQLHMLWYSQNFVPKMYAGDTRRPDLPASRHMRVDVHWVWTPGFCDYLRDLGQSGEINVVGPILWYLPTPGRARERASPDALKVALFDITPLPDGTTAFGALKNYYTVATISRFVSDSLARCEAVGRALRRPVLVLLKHKRAPKVGRHASVYLDFLDELVRTHPTFQLIDHRTSLFDLLDDCDVSISVPYTSTAYVASWLGKPAIYYDSSGEVVPNFERTDLIRFASDAEQLQALLSECLVSQESKAG
jgi:hypothetical protein